MIFGGAKGDLPVTEAAGGLIGETVASMAESCVVSLAGLDSKAAERRFMLAFLERLYRRATGEPFHVVFDEADLFAPQKSTEPQLQNMMEQIVRRGRVKGFIPWLITQRPAVLSKDVLSQADAMKLTSSQDRDAIGGWIEGQADRADEKRMLARLPQLERGRGVVWIPGRGILEEVKFPERDTFDSSRTPRRGEMIRTASLKPIDLGAVKERLASIETEAVANDPKKLKAEIARLKHELSEKPQPVQPLDSKAIKATEDAAEQRGFDRGYGQGVRTGREEALSAVVAFARRQSTETVAAPLPPKRPAVPATTRSPPPAKTAPQPKPAPARAPVTLNGSGELSGPERALLASLAWWKTVGQHRPSRAMACAIAGWRVTSGHIKNVSGSLRTKGYIDYPADGRLALTAQGEAVAEAPADSGRSIAGFVRDTLTGPQAQVFDELVRRPHGLDRSALCEAIGWNVTSGHIKNVLGSMRSMEIVEYQESITCTRACAQLDTFSLFELREPPARRATAPAEPQRCAGARLLRSAPCSRRRGSGSARRDPSLCADMDGPPWFSRRRAACEAREDGRAPRRRVAARAQRPFAGHPRARHMRQAARPRSDRSRPSRDTP